MALKVTAEMKNASLGEKIQSFLVAILMMGLVLAELTPKRS